jgi:hypothetical protein
LLKTSFILLILLNSVFVIGQNTFGSVHSNYCPTNMVILNPSSMANSKTYLDINIVGFGSYTNNNYVYLQDMSLIQAIGKSSKLENEIRYDVRRKETRLFNREFVSGPGATWNKGDHGIGLSFNARSYTGIQHLPAFARPFIEDGVKLNTPYHDIDYSASNIKLASLTFAEIQASYSYVFLKKGKQMFVGGVSLKKFYSIAAGAANIYDINVNVRDSTQMSLETLNMDAMYTPNPKLSSKGGMGLDIGFTYQSLLASCESYKPNTKKSGCRYIPYKYKIGFSIIDIGAVKFKEENIKFAGYELKNFEWMNYSNTKTDTANALNVFENAEATINEGRVNKPTKIKLPTFISLQFDYNVWGSFIYVNASIIQGIPHGVNKFGLRHANSLSISPRFETKWIDFSIPLSLYEYKDPQLGLSMRFGPITIGSDKFINWITNQDIYGADIYFYAKIPIFYHPQCKASMKHRNKGKINFKKSSNCPILN